MEPAFEIDEFGCWVWCGRRGRNSLQVPYQVVWEYHMRQRIPDGGVLHHTCHNRECVNPEHLELLAGHREHALKHGWLKNMTFEERSRRAREVHARRRAEGRTLFPQEVLRRPKSEEHKRKIGEGVRRAAQRRRELAAAQEAA